MPLATEAGPGPFPELGRVPCARHSCPKAREGQSEGVFTGRIALELGRASPRRRQAPSEGQAGRSRQGHGGHETGALPRPRPVRRTHRQVHAPQPGRGQQPRGGGGGRGVPGHLLPKRTEHRDSRGALPAARSEDCPWNCVEGEEERPGASAARVRSSHCHSAAVRSRRRTFDLSEPRFPHLGNGGCDEHRGGVTTGPRGGVRAHPDLSPATFLLDPETPLLVDVNTQPPLASAGVLGRPERIPRPGGGNPQRPHRPHDQTG